jgi:hypothetical protein
MLVADATVGIKIQHNAAIEGRSQRAIDAGPDAQR